MWLSDGRSLFDFFGFEFTLLHSGPRPVSTNHFADTAAKLAVPLTLVDIASDEARDLYGADLALIRPDQIVAWRGNSLADPVDVLRRASGHLGA